ncbi:MAG: Tol-Pal system beta propeller repeat protein TolB [Deltaproteobacteria bacterium]|nr:Tol-Pal system beta propeller repeat protein TolB [Deltaproteobacteria bacterium]
MTLVIRSIVAFIFLLVLAGTASAKLYLDVDQPKALFPIAIVDFKNLDQTPDSLDISRTLARIVSEDLAFTGLFKILEPESFLEDPRRSGITERDTDFQSWSAIGAQGLVKGGFTRNKDEIIIEARLFDVQQARLLAGRRYVGGQETLRRIGHKFSNLIYSLLTGEEGVFETKIAYVRSENAQKEVYLIDFDGYNEKRFSYHGSIALSPEWSPKGEWITFTSYKKGTPALYTKDYASREEKVVSRFPDLNIAPAWSPDGKQIAVTLGKDGNPEIYLMDPEGHNLQRLTNDRGIDVSPAWSPDGKSMAFVSNRSGSPQIYVMDRNGGRVQRITFRGNYNTEPDWSPRGDKIAYSSMVEGRFQICIISPDGTEDMQLTWEGNNESPKWSPNGRHIVFCSTRAGEKCLYTMMANGTRVAKITRKGSSCSPDWSTSLPF